MNVEDRRRLERLRAAWDDILTEHHRLGPISSAPEDEEGFTIVRDSLVEKIRDCDRRLKVGAA